jgi:hypothetical protein
MWYSVESNDRPALIDAESSAKYVYVRRNIREEERTDEMTGEKETFYVFEEQKIPKDVWPVFQQGLMNSERIADVEEVITEILGGGTV